MNDGRVTVHGKWVDDISKPADKTADKVGRAAKKMGDAMGGTADKANRAAKKMGDAGGAAKKMGDAMGGTGGKPGVVPPRVNNRLSQFNERTEKMRQIVMLTGNQLGSAAGQMTFYAGTAAYLFERLGAVEVGVLAVGLAMGGLGLILNESNRSMRVHAESMKAIKKEYDEFTSSISKFIKTKQEEVLGIKDYEQKISELQSKIRSEERIIYKIQWDLSKNWDTMDSDRRKMLKERWKLLTDEVRTWKYQLAELVKTFEEAAAKEAAVSVPGVRTITAERPEEPETKEALLERLRQATKVAMAEEARWNAYAEKLDHEREALQEKTRRREERAREREERAREEELRAEHDHHERLNRLRERDADRVNRILEKKEAAEKRHVAMLLKVVQSAGMAAEKGSAVKIAATILEAGYNFVEQTAAGWASFGYGDYLGAAAHWTSAGWYAALAAKDLAGTSAGGGSAGPAASTSASDREMYSSYREEREEEVAPIIVNVYGNQNFGSDADRDFWESIKRYRESQTTGSVYTEF